MSQRGFQEGYYPSSKEIDELFDRNGFEKKSIISIRGFGYEKEELLYKMKDRVLFDEIMQLIDKTSEIPEIVETCGHAIYVGKKR